jgi:hypothetical protein
MKSIWAWLHAKTQSERGELAALAGFCIVFSFGQLGRFALPSLGAVYLHDIYIALWLAWHWRQGIGAITSAVSWMRRHPLFLVALGWVGLGIVLHQTYQLELRALLLTGRLLMYVLFAGTVAKVFVRNPVWQRTALIVTGNFMIWLGVLQYLFLPDTRFLSILGWDDHYYRMIGPLFDPNFMGMLIILTGIYTASLARFFKKKWLVLAMMYYAAALAVTYSRASFATAIIAAGLLASTPLPLKHWSFWDRITLGFAAGCAFLIVLSLAPKPGGEGVRLLRSSSIQARQSTAIATYQELTAADLIVGNGIFSKPMIFASAQYDGTLAIPQHAQLPDNFLLLLLSGTGIIGTILLLAALLYWIGRLASLETAAAIALGVTIAHSQFNNTLFEPFISLFLLLAVTNPIPNALERAAKSKKYVRKKPAAIRLDKQ